MSIPLFFASVKGGKNKKHIYVDGGLLENYPIKTFDQVEFIANANSIRRTEYYETINTKCVQKGSAKTEYVYNKETLGFRLDSSDEISMYLGKGSTEVKEIKNFLGYTKASQGVLHLSGACSPRHYSTTPEGVCILSYPLPSKPGKSATDRESGETLWGSLLHPVSSVRFCHPPPLRGNLIPTFGRGGGDLPPSGVCKQRGKDPQEALCPLDRLSKKKYRNNL